MILECIHCQTETSVPASTPVNALKCQICGENLIPKRTAQPVSNNNVNPLGQPPLPNVFFQNRGGASDDTSLFDGMNQGLSDILSQIDPNLLMNLFDPSFRDLLEQNLSGESPNRTVNQKYLDALGVLTVDAKKNILYDISLTIGSIHSLLIPAEFSKIPSEPESTFELLTGEPFTGEAVAPELFSQFEQADNKAVLLERGKITFAQKYQTFANIPSPPFHKPKLLLVTQTNDYKFPFVMTDNSKELHQNPVFCANGFQTDFPVCMISQRDGALLKSLANAMKGKSSPTASSALQIHLKCGAQVLECPICCENFEEKEEVYKLSCRHLYHRHCLSRWVQSHPNCPLCRKPLEAKATSSSAETGGRRSNPAASDRPFNAFYG